MTSNRGLAWIQAVFALMAACVGEEVPSTENSESETNGTGDQPVPCVAGAIDEPGPPRLVSGELVGDTSVRLRFSEPVADPVNVDPSSFRLSVAEDAAWGGGKPGTILYRDPLAFLCANTDARSPTRSILETPASNRPRSFPTSGWVPPSLSPTSGSRPGTSSASLLPASRSERGNGFETAFQPRIAPIDPTFLNCRRTAISKLR
jgi:hypothetical protein